MHVTLSILLSNMLLIHPKYRQVLNISSLAQYNLSILQVPNHHTCDFIQLFRDVTNSIRNSSQRLEHLKRLQKTKIKADKDMLDLLTDGVLGSFIGYSEFMFFFHR